jgi:predicted nucleic acid-binding protein
VTHVFWDSNLFIYLWENDPVFGLPTQRLWQAMLLAKAGLVTSSMSLGEVMVGPRRSGDEATALRYSAAIKQSAAVVPFDEKASDVFATIRSQTQVKQPDGINLTCAAIHGVELFVTNDEKLQKLRIPGIHFIVSIETALSLIA